MKIRFSLVAGVAALGALLALGCDNGAPSQASGTQGTEPAAAQQTAPKAGAKADEAVKTSKVAEQAKQVARKTAREGVAKNVAKLPPQALLKGGTLCALSGKAGEAVDCPVRVAVGEDGIPARALQGTLHFDASALEFKGFVQEVCPKAGQCIEQPLSGERPTLAATGHTLAIAPKNVADWKGKGSFILANFSNPKAALSVARVGTDAAQKPLFKARFVLKRDVPASQAATVSIDKVLGADDTAREVPVSVENGLLVTHKTAAK